MSADVRALDFNDMVDVSQEENIIKDEGIRFSNGRLVTHL